MNILIINNLPFNPLLGGIERVTDLITKGFIEYYPYYKLYYLCGKIKDKSVLEYDFPVPLYELPNDGLWENYNNRDYYHKLITDLHIDIIINQRGTSTLGDKAIVIPHNCKIVSVIHSTIDADITINLPNFKLQERSITGRIKWMMKHILYPVYLAKRRRLKQELVNHYNHLSCNSDAIVLLSNKFKEDLYKFIAVNGKSIITAIPNPNTYPLQKVNWDSKKRQILYVGRLSRSEKKPMRLLKIWEILYKKHLDWSLVFIGDGNSRREMEEYTYKNCIPNVKFKGSSNNVEQYYKESTFICLTSDFEGWGMALTEGMAHGCIPMCFNSYAAASDIIDDGVNGCLIPSFDIQIYANRLSELMLDPKKQEIMGIAAQEKVKQFSIDKVVTRWHKLFEQILPNARV